MARQRNTAESRREVTVAWWKEVLSFLGVKLHVATFEDIKKHLLDKHPELDEATIERRARMLMAEPYGWTRGKEIWLTPKATKKTLCHELGHVFDASEDEAEKVGARVFKKAEMLLTILKQVA